jgi:hypothetical protein
LLSCCSLRGWQRNSESAVAQRCSEVNLLMFSFNLTSCAFLTYLFAGFLQLSSSCTGHPLYLLMTSWRHSEHQCSITLCSTRPVPEHAELLCLSGTWGLLWYLLPLLCFFATVYLLSGVVRSLQLLESTIVSDGFSTPQQRASWFTKIILSGTMVSLGLMSLWERTLDTHSFLFDFRLLSCYLYAAQTLWYGLMCKVMLSLPAASEPNTAPALRKCLLRSIWSAGLTIFCFAAGFATARFVVFDVAWVFVVQSVFFCLTVIYFKRAGALVASFTKADAQALLYD